AHGSKELSPTDADVIAAYSAVAGYVLGDMSTDNGAAITDFLAWWQSTGLAGHKIDGWVAVDYTNPLHLRQAIYLFGGIDVGVQIPNVAMDQFSNGKAWDLVPDDGGIDGGHSVPVLGYGRAGFTCVTWGKLREMTNAWVTQYLDEAYALVSMEWLDANGEAPNHLDIAALREDLQALKA
ncbi:MAG TPA: hypothetical protein VM912_02060, partial [Terriglobales bacterium]|nr:hypothetical protein [Terriglobales bacterium]